MRSPEADGMTHQRRGDRAMQVGRATGPGRSEREDLLSARAERHEHSKNTGSPTENQQRVKVWRRVDDGEVRLLSCGGVGGFNCTIRSG